MRFECIVCSSSFFILIILLQSLGDSAVSTVFSEAAGEDEGESEEEEKGPESNDFNEKPFGSVLLDLGAFFAIFVEVGHVDESVDDESEESVDRGGIPENNPVHADADDRQQHSGSDPLNDVPDGEEKEGRVEDL